MGPGGGSRYYDMSRAPGRLFFTIFYTLLMTIYKQATRVTMTAAMSTPPTSQHNTGCCDITNASAASQWSLMTTLDTNTSERVQTCSEPQDTSTRVYTCHTTSKRRPRPPTTTIASRDEGGGSRHAGTRPNVFRALGRIYVCHTTSKRRPQLPTTTVAPRDKGGGSGRVRRVPSLRYVLFSLFSFFFLLMHCQVCVQLPPNDASHQPPLQHLMRLETCLQTCLGYVFSSFFQVCFLFYY